MVHCVHNANSGAFGVGKLPEAAVATVKQGILW